MSLAKSLENVAGKVIAKFGGDVTIRYVSAGDYDVASGTIPDFSTTIESHEAKGVLEDVNTREVNELIQAGDKRLTVAAKDLPSAPETKDRVTIGGIEHQVVRVQTTEQDNTPITYELILRV
jgi:hypothetical protein